MTYFAVSLAQGSSWLYQPPPSHDVAFAFAFDGEPTIQGELTSRALLVMSGSGGIALSAPTAPAAVLIGSAKRHDHPLVVGTSSVHTNPASLARSAERIRALRPV